MLGFREQTLDPALLPIEFSHLTAAEIEDCLCIYEEDLTGETSNLSSLLPSNQLLVGGPAKTRQRRVGDNLVGYVDA